MTKFDIRNKVDVEYICYSLVGKVGKLFFDQGMDLEKLLDLPTNEPILYRTDDGFYSIQQSEIQGVIANDYNKRLVESPSDKKYTIVICNDSDLFEVGLFDLRELIHKNVVFSIHTPSKILAPFSDVYYSSVVPDAVDIRNNRTIVTVDGISNPLCVGKRCECDAPHLAIGLDKLLVKERDEKYIELLKSKKHVYVLDEFSRFLLRANGIEADNIL